MHHRPYRAPLLRIDPVGRLILGVDRISRRQRTQGLMVGNLSVRWRQGSHADVCGKLEGIKSDHPRGVLLTQALCKGQIFLVAEVSAPMHAEHAQRLRKLRDVWARGKCEW